jgi:hypothetical protein
MARNIGGGTVTVSAGKDTCNAISEVLTETIVMTGTLTACKVVVTNSNIRIVFKKWKIVKFDD